MSAGSEVIILRRGFTPGCYYLGQKYGNGLTFRFAFRDVPTVVIMDVSEKRLMVFACYHAVHQSVYVGGYDSLELALDAYYLMVTMHSLTVSSRFGDKVSSRIAAIILRNVRVELDYMSRPSSYYEFDDLTLFEMQFYNAHPTAAKPELVAPAFAPIRPTTPPRYIDFSQDEDIYFSTDSLTLSQ